MKTEITIEKVELHGGKEFEGTNWDSPMQVIYTDKGLFIDNIKGKCFKKFLKIKWEGIDWTPHIGKTVEILIVNCGGKDITSNFKPVDTIEILTSNSGEHNNNCSNHNWAYPLFLLGEV